MTAVLVVGGAHIDRRGRFHGPHADGASTPGSFHEEPGGGGFNAARVMAGLNLAVRMITATGGDANAQEVAQAALDAGVALTPVTFLDRATPTYTAILDHQGGVVAALADMELYERFSPRQIARRSFRAALAEADAVLCDANLPEATLLALAAACRDAGRPLGAIAVSADKVHRLASVLDALAILFMNRREAASLCAVPGPLAPSQLAAALAAMGLKRAVITDGARPVLVLDAGHVDEIAVPSVPDMVDETGAGDACAGATFERFLAGMNLAEAARYGIAAAGLTVRSPWAVSPDLTPAALAAALPLVPQPRPVARAHDPQLPMKAATHDPARRT